MKQNFEKMETKKRPRVNPRVAVNMGKCAACPLVNLCQAARLKRPDIVNDDNCQAVVEHMESDSGGGEYLPSTKEQFNDNSRNMVFATDLHRVPSQKQNVEKQKQLERIAAEKKRRAEQQRDLQLKRQREQHERRRRQQKQAPISTTAVTAVKGRGSHINSSKIRFIGCALAHHAKFKNIQSSPAILAISPPPQSNG